MSRRAALYSVSVHPKGKRGDPLPLGDIDGTGSSAVEALAAALGEFSEESKSGSRLVRSLSVEADGDDLFAIVQYGQRGIAADIVSPDGGVRLRQSPDDEQLVRCGCLFRLPAAATAGRLAVEIDDGRGIESLVEQALLRAFRSRFPGLLLRIDPAPDPNELTAAIKSGRVDKVRLLLVEPPGERQLADLDKWVAPGEAAKIRIEIAAAKSGGGLRTELLERFVDGDASALAEIVRFAGVSFGTVRVGMSLPDATRRMVDLSRPASGRAPDHELGVVVEDALGEPTDTSLRQALRSVLDAG